MARYLRRSILLIQCAGLVPEGFSGTELVPGVRFVTEVEKGPELGPERERLLGHESVDTYQHARFALVCESWSPVHTVPTQDDIDRAALIAYCAYAAQLCYVWGSFESLLWTRVLEESGEQYTQQFARREPWFSEPVSKLTFGTPPFHFCDWAELSRAIQRLWERPDENAPFLRRALWEFAHGLEAKDADHRFQHFVGAIEAVIQMDQGGSKEQFSDEMAKTFRGLRDRREESYKRAFGAQYDRRNEVVHAQRFLHPKEHRAVKHLEWSARTFLRRMLLDEKFARGVNAARKERFRRRAAR